MEAQPWHCAEERTPAETNATENSFMALETPYTALKAPIFTEQAREKTHSPKYRDAKGHCAHHLHPAGLQT